MNDVMLPLVKNIYLIAHDGIVVPHVQNALYFRHKVRAL